MFVPVTCSACGKQFQVPEAAVGKSTACPWCQTTVLALPIAGAPVDPKPENREPALPARQEPMPTPAPEPLSLDDAPSTPPTPRSGPRIKLKTVLIGFVAIAAIAVFTVLILGYGEGRISASVWSEFTVPDGSCSILLPGRPVEEDISANPASSVTGGKRYSTRGWYSKVNAWVAWYDIDPSLVKSFAADKDRVFSSTVLNAERDREKSRLNGTITAEAELRLGSAWGSEIQMTSPQGNVVEWLLLAPDGPRPRLYAFGIQGKNITRDSDAARRLFKSFKINP